MSAVERSSARLPGLGARVLPVILRYAPAALLAGVAVGLSPVWQNSDVSWLITLCEKMLDGARPYIDFLEVDPPASMLLYLPAVMAAHGLGIAPEIAVNAMIFAGAAVSLWAACHILLAGALLQRRELPVLSAAAVAVLLILPTYVFGEREQIALLLVLPMLAVYAVRTDGGSVARWLALVAGFGGGIACSIKPHFALALLFPLSFVLFRARRDWQALIRRAFAPENIATLLVVIFYLASVFAFFPAFVTRMLPLDLLIYVPLAHSTLSLAGNPFFLFISILLAVSVAIGMREFRSPLVVASVLGGIGFAAAFLIQGKGWAYQGYPAIALLMLVLALLLVRRIPQIFSSQTSPSAAVRIAIAAGLLILYAGMFAVDAYYFSAHSSDTRQMIATLQRLAPPKPRILSISTYLPIGFPLTRQVGGIWVGSACCQWISGAEYALKTRKLDAATRATLRSLLRQFEDVLANDIVKGRPDVILIDGPFNRKIVFSHAKIAAALRPYREADKVGRVEIWIRSGRALPGHGAPHDID